MTRFRLLLALGAAALSFATATAQANETEWFYHATICTPANSGDTSAFYNSYGVNNLSSTTRLTVHCPLVTSTGLDPALPIFAVHVSYFDRGTTRTTCTLRNVAFNSDVVYTTSSTSPGYSNSIQTFLWEPPAGQITVGFWELECTIPAVNSGNYSAVTAMYVVAGPPP